MLEFGHTLVLLVLTKRIFASSLHELSLSGKRRVAECRITVVGSEGNEGVRGEPVLADRLGRNASCGSGIDLLEVYLRHLSLYTCLTGWELLGLSRVEGIHRPKAAFLCRIYPLAGSLVPGPGIVHNIVLDFFVSFHLVDC
jgi:hypothetical protein